MKTRSSLLIGLIVCGLSLGACSSDDDSTVAPPASVADSKVASASSDVGSGADTTVATASDSANDTNVDSAPVVAVTSIEEQPGASDDDFVGAAKDVTLKSCKLSGSKWVAEGTVTNESGGDAKYRIYVALNAPGTTDTKALVQANVEVPDGKTETWSVEADVATPDLTCILRVERAAA